MRAAPVRFFLVALVALILAGCAPRPHPPGVNDPLESVNRSVHSLNKGVDTVLVRPVAMGYGTVLPDPARDGVRNFALNISHPRFAVNYALQARPDKAMDTIWRFILNSTLGIGGLFDVASRLGMPAADETDFGETLYRWGVGEGPFVEVPLFGPRTGRAAVGLVADVFTDPFFWVLNSPESYAPTGARGLGVIDARYRFRNLIDDVLYNSADSYARARIVYLQQRRFELGGPQAQSYLGPDGDPESQNGNDVTDPQIDPYAE